MRKDPSTWMVGHAARAPGRRTRAWTLPVVLTVSILCAACGDAGGDPNSDGSDTQSQATPAAGEQAPGATNVVNKPAPGTPGTVTKPTGTAP
jgi:hypothetical protein